MWSAIDMSFPAYAFTCSLTNITLCYIFTLLYAAFRLLYIVFVFAFSRLAFCSWILTSFVSDVTFFGIVDLLYAPVCGHSLYRFESIDAKSFWRDEDNNHRTVPLMHPTTTVNVLLPTTLLERC